MIRENLWDSSARAMRPYWSMVVPLEIPAGILQASLFLLEQLQQLLGHLNLLLLGSSRSLLRQHVVPSNDGAR